MKKFILLMVCTLIMTVFIAFNYLLWDREKFAVLNDSKSVSIDTLGREINSLNETNKQLRDRIGRLEESNKQLQDKNEQTEQEKLKIKEVLEQRDSAVNFLKQKTDLKPMESTIRKWADYIDKGQYEAAYDMQLRLSSNQDSTANLNEFINNCKRSFKSLKVKTLKLAVEGIPDDRKGDMVFQVVLDVKKPDGDAKNQYNDGLNERFFTLVYDKAKEDWAISDISSSP